MNRKLLFVILLRFVVCHDNDSKTLLKIVTAIAKFHYFSFYVILDSHETEVDVHLYEELTKTENSGFTMVAQVPMEKYENYTKNVDDTRRTRCLKIVNGKHKIERDLFAKLTEKVDFNNNDVWLLYLDHHVPLEEYIETLTLQFDVQIIVAYIKKSKIVDFFAPYRVAKDFPLRMPKIGYWTEKGGLYLPVASVSMTRRDMEGFKFRTGTLHYPPATSVTEEGKGGYEVGGFFAEIWSELGSRLNFTFGYKLSVDGTTGALKADKTWSGLVGMLVKEEIDVAVSEFTITEARSHFVDFSIPMMTTGLQIFFTQSGNHLEWGSLLKPFRKEAWLVIFAWFIVAAIALSQFYAIGCRFDFENFLYKQEYTFFRSFFIVFRALTGQGNDMVPESSSCRIVFSSAYLMMGIILPSYSAALISYLTIHTPIRPFTSLETMLQVGTHKLLAARKTAEYAYFSDAKEPLLKEVFEKLVKPVKDSDLQEGMEMICQKYRMAYFGLFLSGKMYIDQFFIEKGCKIMFLETPVSYADATIAFQKGSPYSLVINSEVKRMKFDGHQT